MMLIGHLALCGIFIYLFYRLNIKNISIPAALTLSILPDVDMIINIFIPSIVHKTYTHSIFIFIFFLILALITRKKLVIVYSVFYLTHFFGDMIIEKVNLFFPFLGYDIGTGIKFVSGSDIAVESSLLILNLGILFLDKNYLKWIYDSYLHRKRTNITLTSFISLSIMLSLVFIIFQYENYFALNLVPVVVINLLTALFFTIGAIKILRLGFDGSESENLKVN